MFNRSLVTYNKSILISKTTFLKQTTLFYMLAYSIRMKKKSYLYIGILVLLALVGWMIFQPMMMMSGKCKEGISSDNNKKVNTILNDADVTAMEQIRKLDIKDTDYTGIITNKDYSNETKINKLRKL